MALACATGPLVMVAVCERPFMMTHEDEDEDDDDDDADADAYDYQYY